MVYTIEEKGQLVEFILPTGSGCLWRLIARIIRLL